MSRSEPRLGCFTRSGLLAEEWTDGPTGRLVEVTKVSVRDYGGNVLGTATTRRGLLRVFARFAAFSTQTRVERVAEIVDPQAVHYDDLICGIHWSGLDEALEHS